MAAPAAAPLVAAPEPPKPQPMYIEQPGAAAERGPKKKSPHNCGIITVSFIALIILIAMLPTIGQSNLGVVIGPIAGLLLIV